MESFLTHICWYNQEFLGLNRNFLVSPVTSWCNREEGLNFLDLPGILKHLQTSNQTNMQESIELVTQEPKPYTLLLVGYWLRPEEFGFVCSLQCGHYGT